MFSKLLVPVDFTEKTQVALDSARKFAEMNQASIWILHVIEQIDLPPSETRTFYSRLKKNAQTKLLRMKKQFKGFKNIRTAIVIGNRGEEIIRYSIEKGIDLIVLASHKIDIKKPQQGWGTLSYKIAILSQCPVLLVK